MTERVLAAGDVWVVYAAGSIGGGRQSAQNLLRGLHELGVPLTPIVQISAAKPSCNAATTANGSGLELRLPPPMGWADPSTADFLRSTLDKYRPRVIHLLDAIPHLGTWLAALRDRPERVAVTALDYNWLCVQSHLLTRRGRQCPGPHSATDCLRCHFDHRSPGRRIALRMAHAIAAIPIPWPARTLARIQKTRTRTRERLRSLPADFDRVDALIAPSMALADRFAANGLSKRKIVPIRYGTPPGRRIAWADRPPLDDGVVFGFVGRIEFDKGPDLLIDAVQTIRETTPHRPRVVVFGGPSATGFNRSFFARVRSADCLSWVELANFDGSDPAAIDQAMSRIHFLVAPSRWTDNLPNAVLEALERATPVIAPDQGSFPEMIVPGRNGWLFPHTGNGAALTNFLSRVVSDPHRYGALPHDVPATRLPSAEAADVAALLHRLAGESSIA